MKKNNSNRHPRLVTGALPLAIALAGGVALACPFRTDGQSVDPRQAGPQNRLTMTQTPGWMSRARHMYDMGDYQGAADQLRQAMATTSDARLRTDAGVLLARTLLALRDPECMTLAKEISRAEGASPAGREATLVMGDWLFFDGRFGPASLCYGNIPGIEAQPAYAYRLGVSLLHVGKFDKGVRLLRPLSTSASVYRTPAGFYMAWADYLQGNLQQALQGFRNVAPHLAATDRTSRGDDDRYLPTHLEAGYFIAQIEFRQGHYGEVLATCRSLLPAARETDFTAELNRLAGESLFKLGDLREAVPYLEEYLRLVGQDGMNGTAAYALGAADYAEKRYERAARLLEPLTVRRDMVAQGAALLLGQMAAENKDNDAAALYFDKAWRTGMDPAMTERAMYNHISAMAAGAASPFTSATELPEIFLQRYPSSKFASSVREYLSAAYYRDKDYARALASLDKIPHPTAAQQAARQLVLYELGAGELSNGQYGDAEKHLTEATRGTDAKVSAQARLWLGQALYAQGKFAAAEQAFRQYQQEEPQGANTAQAVYDAAYALYMQDKFRSAADEFSRALAMKSLPARLRTDATVRLADCRYYLRDYSEAARLYSSAEAASDGDRPYAAMRAAMMEGLRGDIQAEIAGLKRMIDTYPDSRWTPAALYEMGSAQSKNGDTASAVATFVTIAERYGQLEEGRRAQLQAANLYARGGDIDHAIDAYQTVIRRWPTGDEAKAANVELRGLMADRGQLAEYAAFLNSVPGAPKVDNAELERLAYEAADNRLIASSSDTAPMTEYLRSYPDGLYLAAALWRLAQAFGDLGQYDKALDAISGLEQKRPDAQQLPEALILRGSILEEHYPERASEALAAYRHAGRLLGANTPPELYAGIMRLTDRPSERLEYARRLREMGGLSSGQAQEADFYEALALADGGDTEGAARLFRSLAAMPSSLYGARGAVEHGLMLIRLKRYKEAEKALKALTDAGTPHAYWLARGYIALADACAAQGRKAVAREYLSALKANYPGNEPDIRQLIDDGLKKYK